MTSIFKAGTLASMLLLAGCSSVISSYKSRAMSKHGMLYKPNFFNGQAIVLTGDRRVALAIPRPAPTGKPAGRRPFYFCAEGMPDVAAAAFEAKGGDGKAQVSLADKFSQTLTQTFQRTENAELFRNWNFTACVAHATGQIDADAYKDLFTRVTDGMIAVMKQNAQRPATPPPAAKPAPPASKTVVERTSAEKTSTESSAGPG